MKVILQLNGDLIITIVYEFWETFEAMAPYLLFGFAMAGMLSVDLAAGEVLRRDISLATGIIVLTAPNGGEDRTRHDCKNSLGRPCGQPPARRSA